MLHAVFIAAFAAHETRRIDLGKGIQSKRKKNTDEMLEKTVTGGNGHSRDKYY